MNAEECRYRAVRSEKDGGYIGICREFPALFWHAPTEKEALEGIASLIRNVLDDIHEEQSDKAGSGLARFIDSGL